MYANTDMRTLSIDELRSWIRQWSLILEQEGVPADKALETLRSLVREAVSLHRQAERESAFSAHRAALILHADQCCAEAYFKGKPSRATRGMTVTTVARKSLSRRLLLKWLATRYEVPGALSTLRLAVDRHQLAAYVSGMQLMPLDVQGRLADLLMKEEPRLARPARQLRLQVFAARQFGNGDVMRHVNAPPKQW